jgi:hypothetical protein
MNERAPDALEVRVRLLADPSLWCWDIVTTASGRLVESSWTMHWEGVDSPDEACAAGPERLTAADPRV